MTRKPIRSLVVVLIVMVFPSALAQDLSGMWSCDDGGTYYIHQIGNTVWWFGENNSNNPDIANVANGAINGDKISLNWADVPKGATNNYGVLVLQVESENKLQKIQSTGVFKGTTWTYIKANALQEIGRTAEQNETSLSINETSITNSLNATSILNQFQNAQQEAQMRMWAIQAETNLNRSNRTTWNIEGNALQKTGGTNEVNKTSKWGKWEEFITS